MAIFIKTPKKTTFTARTKNELISKITRNHIYSVGSKKTGNFRCDYSGWVNTNGNVIRVFNLEKHRHKTAPQYKNGEYVGRKVVKEGHWVAFVYDIPLVFEGNIKQKTRNFTATIKI